jgi:hypothetical protein
MIGATFVFIGFGNINFWASPPTNLRVEMSRNPSCTGRQLMSSSDKFCESAKTFRTPLFFRF